MLCDKYFIKDKKGEIEEETEGEMEEEIDDNENEKINIIKSFEEGKYTFKNEKVAKEECRRIFRIYQAVEVEETGGRNKENEKYDGGEIAYSNADKMFVVFYDEDNPKKTFRRFVDFLHKLCDS